MSEGKSERVSLAPALDNPDNAKAFEEAIKRRDNADYRCYMALSDLGRFVGFEKDGPLGKALMAHFEDDEEVDDILERVQKALKDREEANNDSLLILSGRS